MGHFPSLRRMSSSVQLSLAQYYLDKTAIAINDHFTGTSMGVMTVTYRPQAAATTYDANMIVPDWTTLNFTAYDQIGVTMRTNCQGGDASDTMPFANQLARVTSLLNNNAGKDWSIVEMQVPYAVCGDERDDSFSYITGLLNSFATQPKGFGLDIAPLNTPSVNLDSASLTVMSNFLNSK
jgi:hypothetical protein